MIEIGCGLHRLKDKNFERFSLLLEPRDQVLCSEEKTEDKSSGSWFLFLGVKGTQNSDPRKRAQETHFNLAIREVNHKSVRLGRILWLGSRS